MQERIINQLISTYEALEAQRKEQIIRFLTKCGDHESVEKVMVDGPPKYILISFNLRDFEPQLKSLFREVKTLHSLQDNTMMFSWLELDFKGPMLLNEMPDDPWANKNIWNYR